VKYQILHAGNNTCEKIEQKNYDVKCCSAMHESKIARRRLTNHNKPVVKAYNGKPDKGGREAPEVPEEINSFQRVFISINF